MPESQSSSLDQPFTDQPFRPPILSDAVQQLRASLIADRRDLHRHPEPGFQEVRTAGIVEQRLNDLGYRVRSGVATTGVIGVQASSESGRTLLLRFDMDALPIHEATGTDYASTRPGWMHACGHDGHTSIGMAMARLFRDQAPPGTIKLLFQPAEESPGGAKPMIEEGALEEPHVDACLGLHLWNEVPVGTVGVRPGPTMADVTTFEIAIRGRGGHGAAPHQTIDALVAAAHVIVALQTVVSRNVDPQQPAVLTIGSLHAGSAHNIIAEEARLDGTIRTFDETVRELMVRRLEEVVRTTAGAFGASAEITNFRGYPAVVNDPTLCEIVRKAASDVVGPDRVVEPPPSMGGEDMAYFLRERPGCFFFVGSANEGRHLNYPHHNPRFDFDEEALLIGAEVMARAARLYLGG